MNCCKETDNAIRVIKGDVLEVYFVVDDVEVEYIERVIFSSISPKIHLQMDRKDLCGCLSGVPHL